MFFLIIFKPCKTLELKSDDLVNLQEDLLSNIRVLCTALDFDSSFN